MDRNIFIKQIMDRLSEMNVPYQTGINSDVTISASFKKQDNSDLNYYATMFFDQNFNKVYFFEKAFWGNQEISQNPDFGNTIVNLGNNPYGMTIGSIIGLIYSVATTNGIFFEKTYNEKLASYPQMTTPNVSPNAYQTQPTKKTSKKPIILISVIGVVIIATLVTLGIIFRDNLFNNSSKPKATKEPTAKVTSSAEITPTATSESTPNPTDSAVVSEGVNVSDLGNIMNGQYYFASDDYIFYTTFDNTENAHIYSVKKDGTDRKTIFDGFGWSLVVIDDWLYFSGNQGDKIDGTYNMFRMKLDGSNLQKIYDGYSYGMFLYGDYLYFMKGSQTNSENMAICRSSLTGDNEEVIFDGGYSPIIYKNKLFYIDYNGNLYSAKPDGTNPTVLLSGTVSLYVLGDDKIIYLDIDNNIYTCDLDGTNNTKIRNASAIPIYTINAYNGLVFFAEYNENYNYEIGGYEYTVKSCDVEGGNEKSVFSSYSYGIYMNIVNDKLMLMDYTAGTVSETMKAIVKIMNLDGSNQTILQR